MSLKNTETKPKIDRTKYIIQDKKSETIIKATGEIDGFNFKLRNLDNCTVYLLDWTKGMFIDDCTNCKFIIGPCDGSIFMRTSKNCEVSLISKQLRFRDCQNLKIFTYCTSDPVVENSCLISFAPFNISFPKLKELFVKANFNKNENKYKSVYDFSAEKNINNHKHWEVMDEGEFNYEFIGNESNSACEPIYDCYLVEIKNLIKNPLITETNVNSNNLNDMVSNEINQIDDSVKFSNSPINFEEMTEKKTEILKGNSNNIIGDHSNQEGVNSSNSSNRREDGRHRKTIDIPSTLDFTNSMNNKVMSQMVKSDNLINMNLTNLDNKNTENEIFREIEINNTQANKLNSNNTNNEEFNFILNNDFHPKIQNLEINNNYIQGFQKDSPSMSEGSGDIVIINSNPKIANEIIDIKGNEIMNDFLVVNSFHSDSPINKNGENKSAFENFEVLENEDVDESKDNIDIIATNRLLKDNQERVKKIREIQEHEIIIKAELYQKAQDFIKIFHNKRGKKKEENKIKNKNEEQSYLTNRNLKHPNPWNTIINLIELKEAYYPGTKDISRMRELILSRKRDYDLKRELNKNK